MAQRDLLELLTDFRSRISGKGSGETFRVIIPDVWEHRVVVNKEEIKKELRVQLAEYARPGRKKREIGLSTEASRQFATQEEQEAYIFSQGSEFNDNKIDYLADFYISNLASQFARETPRGYISKVQKTGEDLLVIFTADPNAKETAKQSFPEKLGKQGAVFANLGKVFSLAKLALNKQIQQQFKNIKFSATDENTFQVGHVTAVAQLRAGQVLSQIASKDVNALLGTLQFTGLSDLISRNQELIKKFEANIAYVKPQSVVANNVASKHDATILKQVRDAVEKSIGEMMDRDWANQPGSNSLVNAIVAELAATATKGKRFKPDGAVPKRDFSSSKAKGRDTKIVATMQSQKTIGGVGDISGGLAGLNAASSRLSLRSLIPMLNQRLPEIVRSNMGQNGRLHNRTGRFAESTEIVDIGDNMVISYTYQLAPYKVFERQGSRDPRDLIDISIRELAAGIIRERFTTRRI